jgi:hypothetical protein
LAYKGHLRDILDRHKFKELHAFQMKKRNYRKYAGAYDDLFDAFFSYFERANVRYCSSRLGPNREKDAVYGDTRIFVLRFLTEVGATQSTIELLSDPLSYIILPLVEMQTLGSIKQAPDVEIDLVIDRFGDYDVRQGRMVALPGSIAALLVSFSEAIRILLNLYLSTVAKVTLQFRTVSIATLGMKCILQLVDAIANFSLNFIRREIDLSLANNQPALYKAAKFEQVMSRSGMNPATIAEVKSTINGNWRLSPDGKLKPNGTQAVSLFQFR